MDLREKRENFSLIKLLAKFSEPVLKWEKRHEWRTFKSYSFQDHLRVKFIHVIRKASTLNIMLCSAFLGKIFKVTGSCLTFQVRFFSIILINSIQPKKRTRKLFYSNYVDFFSLDLSFEVERRVCFHVQFLNRWHPYRIYTSWMFEFCACIGNI
ncbi:uncharacterized protein LOC105435935 isoform X1 [Cucumis sativus]|uniref:uncharacterized protein LOC105435935 isoform X1 n=1 Tax=Cucumis sativus TaxID=3659 RepID=UPI0012F48C11|nr:uncharacterized protein LOC105435935 isoform X1 [Cucumis sativus]